MGTLGHRVLCSSLGSHATPWRKWDWRQKLREGRVGLDCTSAAVLVDFFLVGLEFPRFYSVHSLKFLGGGERALSLRALDVLWQRI